MATRPWRGTWLYVGAAAAMTAAGIAKFAGAEPEPTPSAAAGTAAGSTSDGTASQAPAGDGSAATGSGATSTGDGSGAGSTSGTVTIVGSVEQNRYGSVQVSVTFAGSQITAVQTLQLPDRERESQRINQYAGPDLAQEVVAAQSAQIDTVSGATYTSESYAQSVQSAIDQHG